MKRIGIDGLPDDPLAAASVFHQHWLGHVESVLAGKEDVMIVFVPADHTHRQWRRAVVAGLARRYAPRRCNAVAGQRAAIDPVETYLVNAPGVTGQYFET